MPILFACTNVTRDPVGGSRTGDLSGEEQNQLIETKIAVIDQKQVTVSAPLSTLGQSVM